MMGGAEWGGGLIRGIISTVRYILTSLFHTELKPSRLDWSGHSSLCPTLKRPQRYFKITNRNTKPFITRIHVCREMLHMQSGVWKKILTKISTELIRAWGFNYGITTHAVTARVFCVGFPLDMGDLERWASKDRAPHLQTDSQGLMRSALSRCQLIKGWTPLKLHKSSFNVTGDREVVRAQPYDLSGWAQWRTCLDNDARMRAIDHNSLLCLYG